MNGKATFIRATWMKSDREYMFKNATEVKYGTWS